MNVDVFPRTTVLCLRSSHDDGPASPVLFLHVSRRHAHLGLLFGGVPSAGALPFGDGSVVAVHVERQGEELLLRDPSSHAYLCLAERGTAGPFLYRAEPVRSMFHREHGTTPPLPPVTVLRLASIEATHGDPLSGPALATLLAGWEAERDANLALFWSLLDFVGRDALLAMLPLLADQPAYSLIYARLQRRLAAGDGTFPLDTRAQLHREVERFGWSIGAHSYGRPTVVDEESANLTIGRYCSIAGFSTIVLGNHVTGTATTYPFALLRDYWPHAMAGVGLSDHLGRDVVIGHDVWIGTGAVILPGTVIGHGAVIGANAVARGVVPSYAVVVGNPGQVVRYRHDAATIARLLAVAWWDWPDEKVDRHIPLLLDPDIERFLAAAEADARLVPPALSNIALLRPALQSSLFPWSESASTAADAAGPVSGTRTGGYQCHTDMEQDPWWQVDLGDGAVVREVRVHNRLDRETASRASSLSLLASDDGKAWTVLHERTAPEPFGGLDGRPLTWRAGEDGATMRFLRVALNGFTCLHLDQVEAYGTVGAGA